MPGPTLLWLAMPESLALPCWCDRAGASALNKCAVEVRTVDQLWRPSEHEQRRIVMRVIGEQVANLTGDPACKPDGEAVGQDPDRQR